MTGSLQRLFPSKTLFACSSCEFLGYCYLCLVLIQYMQDFSNVLKIQEGRAMWRIQCKGRSRSFLFHRGRGSGKLHAEFKPTILGSRCDLQSFDHDPVSCGSGNMHKEACDFKILKRWLCSFAVSPRMRLWSTFI